MTMRKMKYARVTPIRCSSSLVIDGENSLKTYQSNVVSFVVLFFFFFSSRRRHTRCSRDWSSDVCSSDLVVARFLDVEDFSFERQDGLVFAVAALLRRAARRLALDHKQFAARRIAFLAVRQLSRQPARIHRGRSEEHTSELQSRLHLVCRLLLEKKKST